jgi:hypothetical protein
MKKIKSPILLLVVIFLFSNCSGFYKSKEQNKSDEFLVEKKSPLVLPPDYNELPIPKSQNTSNENTTNDIKNLFNKELGNSENSSEKIDQNKTFENLIIEKIKKN